MTLLSIVFWYAVPENWILEEYDSMYRDFLGVYISMWVVAVCLAFIFIFAVISILVETIELYRTKNSILGGPWFTNIKYIITPKPWTLEHKRSVIKGAIIVTTVLSVFIIGLLPLAFPTAYSFPITIVPGNQHVTYNFWATPRLESYTTTILEENNEH